MSTIKDFRGSQWGAQVSIQLVQQIPGHGLRGSIPRQGTRVYRSLYRARDPQPVQIGVTGNKPCQEKLDRKGPVVSCTKTAYPP